MILFSLIIPVYKVEKYIAKCIQSCLEQTGFDIAQYEIILVDDGTPDRSMEVAESVISEYPYHNVKIIHQKNAGLSAARNAGMDCSKGKYLWFIDSDDWIRSDALFLLESKINDIGHVDILSFAHETISMDGSLSADEVSIDSECSGIDFLARNNFLSACERLYSNQFLKRQQLRFSEGYLWEDAQFNIRALALCSKHYYYAAKLYCYVRRAGSITTSMVSENMECSRFHLVDSVCAYFNSIGIPYSYRLVINRRLCDIVVAAMVGIVELPSHLSEKYKKYFNDNKRRYISILQNSGDLRYYLISILLQINFSITANILKYKMKHIISK